MNYMNTDEIDRAKKIAKAVNNLFNDDFTEDYMKVFVAFRLIGSTSENSRGFPADLESNFDKFFDKWFDFYKDEDVI